MNTYSRFPALGRAKAGFCRSSTVGDRSDICYIVMMGVTRVLKRLYFLATGSLQGLPETADQLDPIELFDQWFKQARGAGLPLSEAMTLATATENGIPSARMVLLKSYDRDGFTFYTNFSSRKAQELDRNPKAALLFYWNPLHRQVRIEGTVSRVSRQEAAAYFQTRPRGSQLGAWASKQSKQLSDRAQLEQQFQKYEAEFRNKNIPLPEFWGGYRLCPHTLEFWQGRLNRLHDRLCYTRHSDHWVSQRLQP